MIIYRVIEIYGGESWEREGTMGVHIWLYELIFVYCKFK